MPAGLLRLRKPSIVISKKEEGSSATDYVTDVTDLMEIGSREDGTRNKKEGKGKVLRLLL